MEYTHELRLKPGGRNSSESIIGVEEGLSRKNSRNRGINFQTVSVPAANKKVPKNASQVPNFNHSKNNHDFQSISYTDLQNRKFSTSKTEPSAYLSRFDVALPTSAELEKWEINDKLRLLALKEMDVVELKDILAETQAKLNESERDLQNLRTVIQRSLYRQLNNEAATKSTKSLSKTEKTVKTSHKLHENGTQFDNTKREENGLATSNVHFEKRYSQLKQSGTPESPIDPKPASQINGSSSRDKSQVGDRSSKLWENLSKPITFIQNIDSMLQHEFEKSLVGENHVSKLDDSSIPRNTSNASNVESTGVGRDLQNKHAQTIKSLHVSQEEEKQGYDQNQFRHLMDTKLGGLGTYNRRDADDMFQAVSNSLWGFVNDVKTNMASLSGEVPELDGNPVKHSANSGFTPKSINLRDKIYENSTLIEEQSDSESVDLLQFSDDEDEPVDLSMYSTMRRKKT